MTILQLATASQKVLLGPFVDSTDFNTEKTGLTIANTDIKLYKYGASSQVSKNSGGATHDANGSYIATLDATDTSAAGALKITVHVATALPVQLWAYVVPTEIYNAILTASEIAADMTKLAGDATAATQLMQLSKFGMQAFTVQASPAPTGTTFNCGLTGSSYPDNCFKDKAIVWASGSNIHLRDCVTQSSVSSTGVVTAKAAFPFTPVAGDTGLLVGVAG